MLSKNVFKNTIKISKRELFSLKTVGYINGRAVNTTL